MVEERDFVTVVVGVVVDPFADWLLDGEGCVFDLLFGAGGGGESFGWATVAGLGAEVLDEDAFFVEREDLEEDFDVDFVVLEGFLGFRALVSGSGS